MLITDGENQIGKMAAMPAAGSSTEWVGKGETAFAQGDLEQAKICFNRALEVSPLDVKAHNNLSVLCWRQGKTEDALNHLVRALELDPDDRDVISNCCSMFQAVGKTGDAEEILQAYLARNPWDREIKQKVQLSAESKTAGKDQRPADFFNEQGEIRFAKGDLEHARACFEMALENDPNSSRACNNLGVLHWQNGQLEEGLNWLYKALDLDGKDGEILRNSSLALAEAGECDTAADLLELFLQQHPDDDQAWTDYRELIKQSASVWNAEGLNGAAGEVYLKTAAALLDVQDRQGAIEALGRAAILRPDDAEPLYQLALMHLDLDQKDDAIGMLRAGLERDPEHRGVVLALARTLIEEGVPEQAQPVLEGYLAGHEDQEVASCLDQAKASDEQQQCA